MALTQVKTQMSSILRTPPTWWDQRTLQERRMSVDTSLCRKFGIVTAWDLAGMVQGYWNKTVQFIVNEIHQKNSRYINNGVFWAGPMDCFMVGTTVEQATPTVVLTGPDVYVLKRMRAKLKEDHRFRETGFEICGKYGLLKTCNDDTAPHSQEQGLLKAKVDFFGRSLCYLESPGVRKFATIGAVIKISEKHFALTAAHVFESNTDRTVPTAPRPEATNVSVLLDDEFFDALKDEGHDELSNSPDDQDPTRNSSEYQFSQLVRFEPSSTSRTGFSESEPVIASTAAICHPEDEHTDNTTTLFMNRNLDWALIDLENWTGYEPVNFLVKDGNSLSTVDCAKHDPQGEVMIVSQACMYPIARCSGTQALIRMPGCDFFQSVFTLESLPSEQESIAHSTSGKSGALVIDRVSGDAYGMLAARCASLNTQYMIPLRHIFQDISHHFRDERVILPTGESLAFKGLVDALEKLLLNHPVGRTTPLHAAAIVGDAVAVKACVIAGADLTARDDHGMVPLHLAAIFGRAEAVQALIAAGAPGEIPDSLGQAALIFAVGQWLARGSSDSASDWHHNRLQTVDLLLRNGAMVDARDGYGHTALHMASEAGYTQVVELLLKHGADVHRSSPDGTALYSASAAGHTQVIELLLQHGADVHMHRSSSDETALYAASGAGHTLVVELLLKHGADVHRSSPDGTALYTASAAGHTQVVELLLKHNADVNTRGSSSDETALYAASAAGHTQVVELLLQHGADVHMQRSSSDETALYAALKAGHAQIVTLLLQHGAEVNIHSGSLDATALHAASAAGHMQIVESLLRSGTDVNALSHSDETALYAASKAGYAQIVDLLLRSGADVDCKDRSNRTSLYAASRAGHAQVVELLLQYGAHDNTRSGFVETALYAASKAGHAQVVELLLRSGTDVNIRYGFDETALYAASRAGHAQVVELLLQYGADVNTRSGFDETALYAASKAGHTQTVKCLLRNGADVNLRDPYNRTALHAASAAGHTQVVELLLQNGADVNARSGSLGKTALYMASDASHTQVVELLLQHGAVDYSHS